MKVEVVDVKVENKGKYRVANVTYKGPEGKVDAKKIMSFTFKDVFAALSAAQQGDVFDVKSVKNDKGYWDWTEVAPAGKNTGATGEKFESAIKATRSTYETPEERAKKQVYIVRQSSLTTALELIKLNGVERPVTSADIISLAREFEAFVFGIEPLQEAVVE